MNIKINIIICLISLIINLFIFIKKELTVIINKGILTIRIQQLIKKYNIV